MEKVRALVAAVPEKDHVSLGRMGEILGDLNLIRTAMETALRSQQPFIGIEKVAASAIRSMGCQEAEVLVMTTMSNLGIGWKDRWMITTLDTFAPCDPNWALHRYKHLIKVGPEQIMGRDDWFVASLFVHLATEDPEFVASEIIKFRKKKHPHAFSPQNISRIAQEIAKISPAKAKRFCEATESPYSFPLPFTLKFLAYQKKVADSPAEVNSILGDAEDLPPIWKCGVIHRAASDMLGLDNHRVACRDIKGVTTLFNALEDHKAYGDTLADVSARLFEFEPYGRDALRLLAGIRSARHRARGLEYMAWRKLHPQPWYPRTILGRWQKPDRR